MGVAQQRRYTALRTQADFDRVFEQGRNVAGKRIVAWVGSGEWAARRLGMKVTKKTFRLATERNRAKRLIRESFRLLRPSLAETPWDLVVIARRNILAAKEPEVRKEMAWALKKLKVKS